MNSRKLALALTMPLLVAACGSSTAEEADDVAAEVTSTTAPVETTITTAASLLDVDRYCELAVAAEAKADEFLEGPGVTDPVLLEAFVVEQRSDLETAIEVADPKIHEPLVVVKADFEKFVAVLVEYDYDIIAGSVAMEAIEDSPELEAAEDAIDAYEETVCGIASDDEVEDALPSEETGSRTGDTGTAGDTGTTSGAITLEEAELVVSMIGTEAGLALVVEGFLTEVPGMSVEDAECFLTNLTAEQFVTFAGLADVDPAEIDLGGGEFAEILILLETCDIPLSVLIS